MPTTTAETTPPAPTGTRPVGALARWWPVPLGVAVMVLAWRLDSSAGYVAGLAIVAVSLLVLLRRRRAVAAAVVVVALVAGLTGPWLGLRDAYRATGVAVTADVGPDPVFVTSAGDVAVLADDGSVVGVDTSGAQVWDVDLPRLLRLWPLPGGRLVAWSGDELVALSGASGAELWTVPASSASELVAVTPEVVVARTCTSPASGPSTCTWSGLDVADGTTVWAAAGAWAPGWPVTSHDPTADGGLVGSLDTSLLTVGGTGGAGGTSGPIELRDAATGQTLDVVDDPDASPVLLGDSALVFRDGEPCTVELVRSAGPGWTSEYPCALRRPLLYSYQSGGTHVGDAYRGEPVDGEGTLAIDLRDGAVRTARVSLKEATYDVGDDPVHVLGAGVDVQVSRDGVTVRDPADGTVLWELTPPGDVTTVQASGDVVVVTRRARPLLLREWFGPDPASADVIEVRDAATGDLRAAVRPRYWAPAPVILDDGVLLGLPDVTGEPTLRVVAD
jgi:hypothetical protein